MYNSHDFARPQAPSEEIFEGGWAHSPNGLWSHPYFTKEDKNRPLSRREAVSWIASHVRWTDNCTIRKGEGRWSIRFLAEAWGWAKSKVERFLKQLEKLRIIRLKTETLSGTASGTARLVISYLFSTCYSAPKNQTETEARQSRDTTETNTKKGKEVKEEAKASRREEPRDMGPKFGFPDLDEALGPDTQAAPPPEGAKATEEVTPPKTRAARKSPTGYTEEFEAAWKAMPAMARKRGSKPEAFKEWCRLKAEQRAQAMEGIKIWSREDDTYAPGAERWLKKQKWIGLLEVSRETPERRRSKY